jgi:hypothetical protein
MAPSDRSGRLTRRSPAAALERRRAAADDSGMSLTEVLIASTLLVVVLTCVMITMDVVNRVSASVSAQSSEYDLTIPAFGPLQNLLRAEVEPAGPAVSGAPTPGFKVVGNFSLTFYANIGTAYNNVTSAGTTGGPALIVAQEVDASGNLVTSSTNCTTKIPCSFQVKQYLPTIALGVSTCPVVGNPGGTCQYSSTFKLLTNVLSVVNNPNPQNGPTQPIFSYNIFDTSTKVGSNLTPAQVQSGLLCTGPGATLCPADVIQSVGVELMVAKPGAGTNGTVDDQTIVYRYAQSPGSTTGYPYQYTLKAG